MKYTYVDIDNGKTRIVSNTNYLSKNFQAHELACNDGSGTIIFSGRLLSFVQAIRDTVGSLTINSAYRTPVYNEKIGGVIGSYHQYGLAIDMSIPKGYTTDTFVKEILKVTGTQVWIGKYNSFVHLDIGHVGMKDFR